MVAALVRRKVGEVRGHGGAPILSRGRRWRKAARGRPGIRRLGQSGARGAPCGTAKAVQAGRAWGAGRGVQMGPHYSKRAPGVGSDRAGSAHQSSRGLSASPPGPREMAEFLAGPGAAPVLVIEGALTCLCRGTGRRARGEVLEAAFFSAEPSPLPGLPTPTKSSFLCSRPTWSAFV